MSVDVQITDEVSPEIQAVMDRVAPQRVAAEIGPRVTRLMQRHFRGNGKNKRGWPSTQFWARAAKATNWQATGGTVDVVCNQIGVRRRVYGGVVRPVNKRMLTIPARSEAYGKAAGEFDGLEVRMVLDPERGRMRLALVKKKGSVNVRRGPKKKDGSRNETVVSTNTGMAALFWLARKVSQKADASVVPSDEQFSAELDKSVEVLMRRPVR